MIFSSRMTARQPGAGSGSAFSLFFLSSRSFCGQAFITACTSALAAFFVKHRDAFAADSMEPICESWFDAHDLEVRFTLPYEAHGLFDLPGQPPASAPARPKVGRNDPCPCGSGRKYKKCHLAEDQARRAAEREIIQLHELDGAMVHELSGYALERFGFAARGFMRDFVDPDGTTFVFRSILVPTGRDRTNIDSVIGGARCKVVRDP